MKNEFYPVFQTAKFIRILIPSRKGKKGEYAVGLCEHDGHEYTILFCSENFPLDILNKIIGKIIRVDPTSGRGLRAVDFKYQDFEVIKENLEATAQEVQKLHVKTDNSENRAVIRHELLLNLIGELRSKVEYISDEFERVRALILCAYANEENDWRNNALNGAITKTPSKVQVRKLFKLFESFFFWNPLLVSIQTFNGSHKSTNNTR